MERFPARIVGREDTETLVVLRIWFYRDDPSVRPPRSQQCAERAISGTNFEDVDIESRSGIVITQFVENPIVPSARRRERVENIVCSIGNQRIAFERTPSNGALTVFV